jgi:hypothetical protein
MILRRCSRRVGTLLIGGETMPELAIDPATAARLLLVVDEGYGENYRQVLGMRLARTLLDQGEMAVRNPEALQQFPPLESGSLADRDYGWPSATRPDVVELSWPSPSLSREPLVGPIVRLSPWALRSLVVGDWATLEPATTIRLPRCVTLLMCDGLAEGPAGRDLLRVSGQVEVLSLPARLHSQILVCGLTDGVGQIEIELQMSGPDGSEVGFAVKSVSCYSTVVPSFYVANLNELEVLTEGQYWIALRVLGEELSRLPIEVGTQEGFENGGWTFGQSWAWDGAIYFGERD